jgi:hypothetical protein
MKSSFPANLLPRRTRTCAASLRTDPDGKQLLGTTDMAIYDVLYHGVVTKIHNHSVQLYHSRVGEGGLCAAQSMWLAWYRLWQRCREAHTCTMIPGCSIWGAHEPGRVLLARTETELVAELPAITALFRCCCSAGLSIGTVMAGMALISRRPVRSSVAVTTSEYCA